jgi:hypothetical protein
MRAALRIAAVMLPPIQAGGPGRCFGFRLIETFSTEKLSVYKNIPHDNVEKYGTKDSQFTRKYRIFHPQVRCKAECPLLTNNVSPQDLQRQIAAW